MINRQVSKSRHQTRTARKTIWSGAVLLTSAFFINGAMAQTADFPVRPVRIVVPTSPGGVIDIVTRLVGAKASELAGQSFVIDNRSGASTTIGTDVVAHAPADGYTLLSTTLPFVINPSVFKKLPFDAQKDFAPLSLLTSAAYVLVVNPSLPVKSVQDLIALAKAKPGTLNYSSGGNGTNLHVAAELFNMMAAIKMVHVPYKGGGPALTSLISGETALSFPSLPATLPYISSKRLHALGISSMKRSSLLPSVPTIAESGLPGYEFTSWVGLLAPAKTPPPIINLLNSYWVKAARSPEVAARFATDGTEVIGSTPAQFAEEIATALPRWAKVVKTAGLQAD